MSWGAAEKVRKKDDHDDDPLHISDKIQWDGSRIVVADVVVVVVVVVVQLLPTKQTIWESNDVTNSVDQTSSLSFFSVEDQCL